MFLYLVQGIFTLANTFIAVCIVVYALLFLKKTKSHKERRPWDYLFVASVLYLTYTLLTMLLTLYHIDVLLNLGLGELSVFFQFLYTGLILLAFISQTDLIFKNEIIIITRKLQPGEKSKTELNVGKELTEEEKKKKAAETEKSKKDKVYIS
jgi:amino acid transporter